MPAAHVISLDTPDAEEWGWYSMAQFKGCEYLVGACALGEAGDAPPVEWPIRIHKQRSFVEKLLGRVM